MGAMLKSISSRHFRSFPPVSLSKSMQLLNQQGYQWQACFMPRFGGTEITKDLLNPAPTCQYRLVEQGQFSEEMGLPSNLG